MAGKIKKITIVGSGIMGRGIACAALTGGFSVTLNDLNAGLLELARVFILETLQKGLQKGLLTPADMAAAAERLNLSEHLGAAVENADLVIEAASEDLALKLKLFQALDRMCLPGAILSTNTSSLSITEMAAVTGRPGQVVGMHFFNPVPKMKLVEIVRGLKTSEETIRAVAETAGQMGKETVVVSDFPGFATSRLNVLIGNEAFYMLMEGLASAEDIDKAAKLGLNHPMGPLEMGDLVGLDTRLKVLEHLHRTLGERFRPCPLMVKYVQAGLLGRKTGEGVYKYENVK